MFSSSRIGSHVCVVPISSLSVFTGRRGWRRTIFCCLPVLDGDAAEEEAAGLADRTYTAPQTGFEVLLHHAAVDHVGPQTRGHVPDVVEGDDGELEAPAEGAGYAAEDGQEVVAASLAAVEAAVGQLPHAVDGVTSIGFSQDVFETHLNMVVDVVLISVDQIHFSHVCVR